MEYLTQRSMNWVNLSIEDKLKIIDERLTMLKAKQRDAKVLIKYFKSTSYFPEYLKPYLK